MTPSNASSVDMCSERPRNPAEVLGKYKLPDNSLYTIGLYDTGVTVLSQQTRALNLVWALVEGNVLRCRTDASGNGAGAKRIAIIGAGFAGLSLAAGLLAKETDVQMTIFERRDTLLPLQHGSDSRWLHPHIYDWPRDNSQAAAAMLPLLNWTAGRASDVVVQVLTEWRKLVESIHSDHRPTLFCNTRHLQISEDNKRLRIEWVGDRREPCDGTGLDTDAGDTLGGATCGSSDYFDEVFLTLGFGLEKDNQLSYWRNDFIAQPSLDEPRQVYIISGQGDGAMIDLLRASISQFRQDRILHEIFGDDPDLLKETKALAEQFAPGSSLNTYEELKRVFDTRGTAAVNRLRRRLRRDTSVVLRLKARTLSELFGTEFSRISFQNRVLVYLLYRCGGFMPSFEPEKRIAAEHGVPKTRIIRRHGTQRDEQLKGLLSESLYRAIEEYGKGTRASGPRTQTDDVLWTGGYFGFPGLEGGAPNLPDERKASWRKEYLPGATQVIASAFCSSIAGFLSSFHNPEKRLRVTLHRAMSFGGSERLQQCCEYQGLNIKRAESTGRTFDVQDLTIGLCYRTRVALGTKEGIEQNRLQQAMEFLKLRKNSSKMADEVRCVIAVPFLESEDSFTDPAPVCGVLYIDSTDEDFRLDSTQLRALGNMCASFLQSCEAWMDGDPDRIVNIVSDRVSRESKERAPIDQEIADVFETLDAINPPTAAEPFQFNFDYSDFRATGGRQR
ncbi:FAD-dependent oxidoreductase [Rhizobium laguerreae]|uniref:FAD-dependent oxidoreductase n=1 Tax=Rhizobium laguerreae TaxID=1076926 RepID=UPI001C907098|nr:FAD-dependent oxidoreductase [Rhizobium laguerreae]MBY3168698.1 FAD-dependent oxidoreductase [Rhizobium laguerreae]